MFRKTKRSREQLAAMCATRDANRMNSPAPDYPPELPTLRREIIVIDHDFSRREHHIQLFRTNRIDCYRVEIDGKLWKRCAGWSTVLEGLRKSMPRVSAAI